MVEVPLWVLAAMGGLFTVLLAIIGFLIRSHLRTAEERYVEQDEKIVKLQEEATATDKRFLEQELAFSRQFVDKEAWTRDYVTLTGRMDGLHKKLERLDRDQRDLQQLVAGRTQG